MVLLVVAVANGKMVQLPDQSLFHGHVLQSLGNLSICQRDHRRTISEHCARKSAY